ncbi:hypothetical protein IJ135_00600 [Candidatus Saccharibacteria bacterium]|nr:hypothetical protein [Candidatus Saccharibacteria bacterium]
MANMGNAAEKLRQGSSIHRNGVIHGRNDETRKLAISEFAREFDLDEQHVREMIRSVREGRDNIVTAEGTYRQQLEWRIGAETESGWRNEAWSIVSFIPTDPKSKRIDLSIETGRLIGSQIVSKEVGPYRYL